MKHLYLCRLCCLSFCRSCSVSKSRSIIRWPQTDIHIGFYPGIPNIEFIKLLLSISPCVCFEFPNNSNPTHNLTISGANMSVKYLSSSKDTKRTPPPNPNQISKISQISSPSPANLHALTSELSELISTNVPGGSFISDLSRIVASYVISPGSLNELIHLDPLDPRSVTQGLSWLLGLLGL